MSKGNASNKDARAERLAAALRANLRRRKDQDRARKSTRDDAPASESTPAEPNPESEKQG